MRISIAVSAVKMCPILVDGQVIRDRVQLRVKINGTLYLNDTLSSFRPLQAEVLFLGGLPPATRLRRQTTNSTISSLLAAGTHNILSGKHFKGVLQDIQVDIIFSLITFSFSLKKRIIMTIDSCKLESTRNG